VEDQNKDLRDYLISIRRRKTGILVIATAIMCIAVAVAFLLPPNYKSSATILIEQQEIPPELVMSTVTSYAAERIQNIQARVMSRSNLLDIIDKFNLYEDERKYETTEEILEKITSNINLDVISADVVDPRTGRPSTATIAFSLSFQGENPSTVQRVANELASLYLNENLKNRTQKAEDTSDFFQQEISRLGTLVTDLEHKLADFKQKNADMLPELQQLNLQILQRKETDLTNFETRLNTLEEKKFYLIGQLAQIDPGNPNILGSSTKLKLLEAEYASARARYSDDHPDVQKLKREIESLRKETGTTVNPEEVAKQLIEKRTELAQLKKNYSPEHPDVINLEKSIDSLNEELKTLKTHAEDNFEKQQPDNPAYITLQAQLAGIESEIKSTKTMQQQMADSIKNMENNMLKAPLVEREYRALTRDYDNAVREYQETKTKQVRADTAKQLESEKKGERFVLIDPPALPEEPISPNRPAILFLGFVFSLGSGIGFAFVADAIGGAVRGARQIQASLGVAPLAVIPYQMNLADIQKKNIIRKRTIIVGLLAIVIGILLIHFLISPLDVLWFRILRKFEIFAA
jgi:succinoglycan biosynthesis transport protein ExoP